MSVASGTPAGTGSRPEQRPHRPRTTYVGIAAPIGALIVVVLSVAGLIFNPAYPRKLRMATGVEGGAYNRFGEKYKEILAGKDYGVQVELVQTEGAGDNLRLLTLPESDPNHVDIGFVQGGLVFDGSPVNHKAKAKAAEDYPNLQSLGSVFYEPVWIFHRLPEPYPTRIADLKGRRVAIGGVGTGTLVLLEKLLPASGLEIDPTLMVKAGGKAAVQLLQSGEIDVAIFSVAEDSRFVRELSATPGVRLMSLDNAEAYTRTFMWLARSTLPKGAIDIARNLPAEDAVLIAPTASLAVRKKIHPAIKEMLVQASTQIHGEAGPFQKLGEFPSIQHQELPLADEARSYITEGPSRLYKWFPFWLATLLLRIGFVLPVAAVIFSIIRFTPSIYDWHVRSRICRWYGELRYIEEDLERAGEAADLESFERRIRRIDRHVSRLSAPVVYSDRIYTLRGHVSFVQEKLRERGSARAADGEDLAPEAAGESSPASPAASPAG